MSDQYKETYFYSLLSVSHVFIAAQPELILLVSVRNRSPLMKLLLENRTLGLVTLSQFIRVMGRSVAWIFTPLYLLIDYHDTYFQIGMIFFLSSLISLPVSIYGGNLIDRVGRRVVSIVSPVVSSALFFGLFLSSFIHLPAMIVYILFVLIYPFADLEGIADNVMISDTVSPEQRNDAFSLARISANVGFSMGPAIGGFIALYGFGYTFFIPFVTSLAVAIIYLIKMAETRPASTSTTSKFSFPAKDREFIYFPIMVSMAWFIAGQWGTTLTLFLNRAYDYTSVQIGVLYSLNGIIVILFQLPVNAALKRFTDVSKLSIGVLIYAVTFFTFSLTSYFPFVLLDTAILTIGENAMAPASQTIIAKLAPESRRGEYFGAFGAVSGMIVPLAPLFGTLALGYLISTPILFWSIFLYLGLILSVVLKISGKISKRVD